jgi:hypothetical protein
VRNLFKYEGWYVCRFFLFEPELNACTSLILTRNCLFLNPKKEKILKHATHLLDSKISKNPMNEFAGQ